MFEKRTFAIGGVVATGLGFVLTVLSDMVNLLSNDMSTMGAVIIAMMGASIIALAVFALDNRNKLNKLMEEES